MNEPVMQNTPVMTRIIEEPAISAPPPPVLEIRQVERTYRQGGEAVRVFREASMAVRQGEMVALVGPSGSGKSSLLHIAGLMEAPDAGDVTIRGAPASKLGNRARTQIRRDRIGFVYQSHHLLPEFSALENVMIPQLLARTSRRAARAKAVQLLTALELDKRLRHLPSRLSGGEQQRVAIARAVANDPDIILADEPTGNLDTRTAKLVYDHLLSMVRQRGVAAIIATHNLNLARSMDRVILLRGGKLYDGADLAKLYPA